MAPNFSGNFMVLRPEEVSVVDLIRFLWNQNLKRLAFLEYPTGKEENVRRTWIIFISLLGQKILQSTTKPMSFFGSVFEMWLNLVSSNRNIAVLLLNFFRGKVVKPTRSSATFMSAFGFLDKRMELLEYKDYWNGSKLFMPIMAGEILYEVDTLVTFIHEKSGYDDITYGSKEECERDLRESVVTFTLRLSVTSVARNIRIPMERKLVVLGIPWDVDTDSLREYMSKFGDLEDCIVMKERSTGRSRGFGYVTFATVEDAKNALSSEHILGNRMLEVKIATPKEEMRAPAKKVTRIFVARIPPSVTEAVFRSHFEEYGDITDLYMPKDQDSKAHRGIGFITFASAESVDNLMSDTHELGGSNVVVDRATPKANDFRPVSRMPQGGYGAYNTYISAATRYAALGAPTLYDHPGSVFGRESARGMGSKKIFVGRLPPEATTEDLRQYFGRFGRIIDVYVPKVRRQLCSVYINQFDQCYENLNVFVCRIPGELATEVLDL
ncbi:RNA-binding protein Musashi 1 [Tripterygium wilfordii]|uniref:RNA-binding protein Musashi 1 n=1 Tax=Tripterygium wilfordii TaxID=458696 RepID=A0A7J7CPX5_TRIWF|nr:RNA-binding protein Musashi 1 [Tripterygium wilfordii]